MLGEEISPGRLRQPDPPPPSHANRAGDPDRHLSATSGVLSARPLRSPAAGRPATTSCHPGNITMARQPPPSMCLKFLDAPTAVVPAPPDYLINRDGGLFIVGGASQGLGHSWQILSLFFYSWSSCMSRFSIQFLPRRAILRRASRAAWCSGWHQYRGTLGPTGRQGRMVLDGRDGRVPADHEVLAADQGVEAQR